MVVVGAGASYDCLGIGGQTPMRGPNSLRQYAWHEVRPPLTRDLLGTSPLQNEILARYELAGGIAIEVRKRLGGRGNPSDTLERVLGEIADREDHDDSIRMRLLAFQFYLRDLFLACTDYALDPQITGEVNNYTDLVHTARTWAARRHAYVTFVNFNYDMLLDHACERETHFRIGEGPASSDGRISVLRPHGAAAWEFRPAGERTTGGTRLQIAQRAIRERRVPEVDDTHLHVDLRPVDRDLANTGTDALPVLALPIPGKSERTLVWPPSHNGFFDSMKGNVTHMVILGWRAMDEHFTPRLASVAQPDCPMLIVAGGDDAENDVLGIEGRLKAVGARPDRPKRAAAELYAGGFTQLMEGNHLQAFLEQH